MRRWWWLIAALFLSIGLNLGLLVGAVARRAEAPPLEEPPVDWPGDERIGEERPGEEWPVEERPGEIEARLRDRLGLSPAEAERFAPLQRSFFATSRRTRLEIEEVRMALRRELTSESPDRGRVDELVERSARLHGDLESAFAAHVLEARELLDGEAEARYLHFLARLAREGQGGPGQGPGFGPGERPGPQHPRRQRRPPPG